MSTRASTRLMSIALQQLIEIELVHHRVQVDALEQPCRSTRSMTALDVDPLDDHLDVDLVDDRPDVDPVDDRLDVDLVDDRLDVDPLDDLVDVDGVDDAGRDLVGDGLDDLGRPSTRESSSPAAPVVGGRVGCAPRSPSPRFPAGAARSCAGRVDAVGGRREAAKASSGSRRARPAR